HAEPRGAGAAVEHGLLLPRMAAEHDELGVEIATRQLQVERQMWPIEVEQSHGRVRACLETGASVDRGLREPMRARRAIPAMGVVDVQADLASGWSEAVLHDRHVGPLADDVPAEPQPAGAIELEPDTGRFGDRSAATERRGLQHDQATTGALSSRGEPSHSVLRLIRET